MVVALQEALDTELRNPSDDAPALFPAAFEALRRLSDENPLTARANALRTIAVHYYSTAKALAGIAPAQEAVRVARMAGDPQTLEKSLRVFGILLSETGNLPGATEAYSEALDLASAPVDQCSIWINIGALHIYACQYAESIACNERAIEIGTDRPECQANLGIARSNIAVASLHCGDIAKGLRAAQASIAGYGEATDSIRAMARTDLENCTTRLLLETGDVAGAQVHATLASRFARMSRSPRAEMMAEVALGLTDVHAGAHDAGLSRLKRILARARDGQDSLLPDALRAAVKGYEVAGQPDVALVYLRELVRLRADARQAQILMHHTQYLSSLDHGIDDQAVLKIEQHQAELRGRLSDREVLKARIAMLEQNAVAGELHDDTTGEHCYRVGRLASLLAQEYGVDEDTCFLIDLAARLHDIGKLAIPDAILLKPGKLTPGEFAIIQTHTTHGADILSKSRIPQMHVAEEIALSHHERWDGNGYPNKLRGASIPLAARITALSDVYDALTHARPYKKAWTVEESLREIGSLAGKHFDPQLTAIFLELVPRLQRDHGDLDAFLAIEAQNSPFIKARRDIAAALKGPDGNGIDLNNEFNARR